MHVIPPHQPSVTLYSPEGALRTFKSGEAAVRELGSAWLRRNVHPRLLSEEELYWAKKRSWLPVENFCMRDEAGDPVLVSELLAQSKVKQQWRPFSRYLMSALTWNGEGPVPGSGRSRFNRGRTLREPRTQAARRQAALVLLDDGEVPPRAKRNANNLPTAWDDVYIHSLDNDNWKRYRKTQYKPKKESYAMPMQPCKALPNKEDTLMNTPSRPCAPAAPVQAGAPMMFFPTIHALLRIRERTLLDPKDFLAEVADHAILVWHESDRCRYWLVWLRAARRAHIFVATKENVIVTVFPVVSGWQTFVELRKENGTTRTVRLTPAILGRALTAANADPADARGLLSVFEVLELARKEQERQQALAARAWLFAWSVRYLYLDGNDRVALRTCALVRTKSTQPTDDVLARAHRAMKEWGGWDAMLIRVDRDDKDNPQELALEDAEQGVLFPASPEMQARGATRAHVRGSAPDQAQGEAGAAGVESKESAESSEEVV